MGQEPAREGPAERPGSVPDGKRKFRQLFESMSEGFALHKLILNESGQPADCLIIDINPAYESILGLKREEVVGKKASALCGNKEPPYLEILAGVALSGQPRSFETYLVSMQKHFNVAAFSPGKGYFATVFSDISERKKSEAVLQESEREFRSLFEANQAIMMLVDPASGKIVDANQAASTFYGYSRQDLARMNTAEISYSLSRAAQDAWSEPSYSHDRPAVYRQKLANGEIKNVEVYPSPITIGNRRILFYIIHDVTHRERAEQALQESERLYRSLFANMLNGFAYCRMVVEKDRPPDFIYLAVNDSFERLTGLKKVVGRRVSEVIPGIQTSDPGLLEIYSRVASGGKAEQFELFLASLQMWFAESVYCPRKGYFVMVFDVITERKKAEEGLHNANRRLENIIEGTQVGAWEWNVQTGETVFNETWAEMLGYTLEELAPVDIKTMEELLHPDDLKKSKELLQRHFAGESPYYYFECRMRHKEGHWVWIEDRGQIITRTADGLPLMMFGTHTDITDRKKDEESLKEEVRIRSQFIDILAHELRGPLSPILSSSSILKDKLEGSSDQILKRLAANTWDGARVLSARLEELLELARYSRGSFTLNPTANDVQRFVEDVVVRFRPAIEQNEHKLVVDISRPLPGVKFDSSKMEQVLINLLSNASKYSPANTSIRLWAGLEEGQFCLTVSDEGKGLSEIDQKRLFLPYHRLDRDRQNSPGLGLGLSICKQIVEAHGGQIQVISKLGKGSTFKVLLPLN